MKKFLQVLGPMGKLGIFYKSQSLRGSSKSQSLREAQNFPKSQEYKGIWRKYEEIWRNMKKYEGNMKKIKVKNNLFMKIKRWDLKNL